MVNDKASSPDRREDTDPRVPPESQRVLRHDADHIERSGKSSGVMLIPMGMIGVEKAFNPLCGRLAFERTCMP